MARYYVHKAFVESSRKDHHVEISMRWRYPLSFCKVFILWYLLYTLDSALIDSQSLRPLVTYTWILTLLLGPMASFLLISLHITPVFSDPWSSRTCLIIELTADAFITLAWLPSPIITGILLNSTCDPKSAHRPPGCDRAVAWIAFQSGCAFMWVMSLGMAVHGYLKKFVWEMEDHEMVQHAETMATLRRFGRGVGGPALEAGEVPLTGGRSRRGSLGSNLIVSGVAGKCQIRSRSPSLLQKLNEDDGAGGLKKSESAASVTMASFKPIKSVNSTASNQSLANASSSMGSRVNSNANLLVAQNGKGGSGLKKSGSTSSISNLGKKGGNAARFLAKSGF
ncbi:hypothetical protein BC829DRAFT_403486 [Chytridium lagenaria]|nr:hypothetical protein BC829DRAFT_403486 [Chytridium lagenaria]